MTFNYTLNLGEVLTAAITLATILVIVYWSYRQYYQMQEQIKIQNEQIRISLFSEYTKRYQEIILHFPENINEKTFSYDVLDEAVREETMRYMRVYFDLCSEEYFLMIHKYILPEVWQEWETGMTFAFAKPAFREAWQKISADSGFYQKFEKFVNDKMASSHDERPEAVSEKSLVSV